MTVIVPRVVNRFAAQLHRAVAVSEFTQLIVDNLNARSLQRAVKTERSAYVREDGTLLWRSEADRERFALYDFFRDLYAGNHEQWLRPVWLPTGKSEYKMVNLARKVSTTYADISVGGGAQVFTGREDLDRYFNDDLRIDQFFYHWFLMTSIYGFWAVEVIKTDEDEIDFLELQPDIVYPQFKDGSRLDFDWIAKKIAVDPDKLQIPVDSAWEFDPKRMNGLVFEERHFKGKIEYYLFTIKDDEIVEMLPVHWFNPELPPYKRDEESGEVVSCEETGVDDYLIVVIPNDVFDKEFFSDYHDIANLISGINSRLTHIDRILNIHSDPKLMVPDSFQQADPRTGENVSRALRDEVLFMSPEDAYFKPEYLTWNAQLEQAYTEIRMLVNFLGTVADISPVLLLQDESQFPDSAAGLKLKLTPTLNRCRRKKDLFEPACAKFIYVFSQMLFKEGKLRTTGAPPEMLANVSVNDPGETAVTKVDAPVDQALIDQRRIKIRFRSSLPQDERFLIERLGGAQSISTKRALEEVDDMTEEEAEEELRQIREENEAGLTDNGLGGGGAFDDIPGGHTALPPQVQPAQPQPQLQPQQLNPNATGLQSSDPRDMVM